MNFIKLEEYIWQYRRLFALLIVVMVIQVFELALLHYKYNLFTGGFLQPVLYQTFSERALFFIVSTWFDYVFFGVFAVVWFFIADRLNKHGVYIYYIFSVLLMLLMGGWLGFKFKVLSYFSDTVNFLILQNLGGGDFKDAFLYASNEISLFLAVVIFVAVLFVMGYRYLKKFNYARSFPVNYTQQLILLRVLIVCIVLAPFMVLWVSSDDKLRYGMQKKTSFYVISHLLDTLSDVDFDGFGSFNFPRDPKVFDADIFPGALDIPDNGIDEDGFFGDALMPPVELDYFAQIAPQQGKHIVLIVLESARSDLLDKKVHGQYVAPAIRQFAKNSTVIKEAYSHTGYTTTSLKAIFNRSLVGSDADNLLGFLHQSGYVLSIISGQDESFGDVANKVGMKLPGASYFDARTAIEDRVYVSKSSGSLRLTEERVVDQFKSRVNELDFSAPQFIYLNFQAAHFPYSHPKMAKHLIEDLIPRSEISLKNKDWVTDSYWNAIASADWAVGEVLNTLKEQGVLKNSTVVILGDHGESLFDNGFLGHGHAVDDAQTRIPLIINDKDINVKEAMGQVDVAELAVRSALGLQKNYNNKDKVVFQLVGNLKRPILIAHVRNGGDRVVFDFRTEQAYFSDSKEWKSYQEVMADEQSKKRVERLIRQWESLRWQEHLLRKVS